MQTESISEAWLHSIGQVDEGKTNNQMEGRSDSSVQCICN